MPCKRFAEPTPLDVQEATDILCYVTDAVDSGKYPPEAMDDSTRWVIERLRSVLNALGMTWSRRDDP